MGRYYRRRLSAATIDPIVKGCKWLQHCYDDREKLPEPEWYAMLSILARCENGENLAHEWSKDYPKYSHRETQDKLEHALKSAGPYTCRYIRENLNDEYCPGCKSNVTSPVVLGLPKKTAYFNEQGSFIPAWLAEDLLQTTRWYAAGNFGFTVMVFITLVVKNISRRSSTQTRIGHPDKPY